MDAATDAVGVPVLDGSALGSGAEAGSDAALAGSGGSSGVAGSSAPCRWTNASGRGAIVGVGADPRAEGGPRTGSGSGAGADLGAGSTTGADGVRKVCTEVGTVSVRSGTDDRSVVGGARFGVAEPGSAGAVDAGCTLRETVSSGSAGPAGSGGTGPENIVAKDIATPRTPDGSGAGIGCGAAADDR